MEKTLNLLVIDMDHTRGTTKELDKWGFVLYKESKSNKRWIASFTFDGDIRPDPLDYQIKTSTVKFVLKKEFSAPPHDLRVEFIGDYIDRVGDYPDSWVIHEDGLTLDEDSREEPAGFKDMLIAHIKLNKNEIAQEYKKELEDYGLLDDDY